MDQTRLLVTSLRGVRFGVQRAGERWQIERYHRAGQPSARMRPEPLV